VGWVKVIFMQFSGVRIENSFASTAAYRGCSPDWIRPMFAAVPTSNLPAPSARSGGAVPASTRWQSA
jgi:hypothetical protein